MSGRLINNNDKLNTFLDSVNNTDISEYVRQWSIDHNIHYEIDEFEKVWAGLAINFEPNSKEENAIYHACLEIDTMSWYGGEFFDIDDTIITFQHYSNFIKFEYYWDFTCWKWIFKDVSSCEKCERN